MKELVIEISKIIDESAYQEWLEFVDGEYRPHESVRQKYKQSSAECKAVEIMKRLSKFKPKQIADALIEFETQGWERLGIPKEALDTDEAKEIIKNKYA